MKVIILILISAVAISIGNLFQSVRNGMINLAPWGDRSIIVVEEERGRELSTLEVNSVVDENDSTVVVVVEDGGMKNNISYINTNASFISLTESIDKNKNISYFCVTWNVSTDEWWSHHPGWDVKLEDESDDYTCFYKDHKDGKVWSSLYKNQFTRRDCNNNDNNNIYTQQMISSGFGTDLENAVLGLRKSMLEKRTLVIKTNSWWHYSANKKDGTNATCSTKDMNCYFLPITKNCPYSSEQQKADSTPIPMKRKYIKDYIATYNFITRQQQWLRKEVYFQVKKLRNKLVSSNENNKCAVMHVRRADVVLHGSQSRKYFPISDYVDLLPSSPQNDNNNSNNRTVLLLTDDANAIDEALEFYPNINWIYFDRKRHRGTEGGWEQQVPSSNPKAEVITILATFRLVSLCDTLIHSRSKFADTLRRQMTTDTTKVFQVDSNVTPSLLLHTNNSQSVTELETMLQKKREYVRKQK